MITATIQTFRQAVLKKRASGFQAYKTLLKKLIDGVEVDPSELEVVLQAAGKKPDDLQADCEKLQKRIAARKRLDAARVARPELQRIENEIAAKQNEKQIFLKRHAGELQVLLFRRLEVFGAADGIEFAESELRNSCMDPELIHEMAELRAINAELATKKNELDDQRRTIQASIAKLTVAAERAANEAALTDGTYREFYERQAKQAEYQLSNLRQSLGHIDDELSGIRLSMARNESGLQNVSQKMLEV